MKPKSLISFVVMVVMIIFSFIQLFLVSFVIGLLVFIETIDEIFIKVKKWKLLRKM